MERSAHPEHGRGRRALLAVGVAVALLAAVAIASSGNTPTGDGGVRRPADRLLDVFISLYLVALPLGGLFLLVSFVLKRGSDLSERASGRARRGRGAGLAVSALFFLGVAGLVKVLADRVGEDQDQSLQPLPGSGETTAGGSQASDAYKPEFAPLGVALVLAVVGASVLAWYLSERARRRRLGAGPPPLGLVLADVLDETVDDLRAESDPRRAVVAAYARLERTLSAYGLPRRPSEAPEEYLARILADLEVGRLAARRLTTLFETAKFSRHEVDETMRDEAIAALEAVRQDLRAAEARAEAERAAALEARQQAIGLPAAGRRSPS